MNRQPSRTVLALMGPTASGKSELGMRLADEFNIALISVDSAMAYRGMDIGTAKPDSDTLQKYPHALVDILDPEDDYSVGEFIGRADRAVNDAFESGKTPLLVGGSMLYFKRFRDGVAKLPGRNSEIRSQLRQRADEGGVEELFRELQQVDPSSARRIHPNNYSRIERALEVYEQTGKPMSQLVEQHASTSVVDRLQCDYREFSLLNLTRAILHDRIEKRVYSMLDLGFADEVTTLMQRPNLSLQAMSMRAVGYRQLWQRLACDIEASIDSITINAIVAGTRQLARRQLTWLRNWKTDAQHVALQSADAYDCVKNVLQSCRVPRTNEE